MTANGENQYENVIGSYFGLSGEIKCFEPVCYVGIPLHSDYTLSKSPVQIGFKVLLKTEKFKNTELD